MRHDLRYPITAASLALLAVVVLLGQPILSEARAQESCTLETVAGTYVFHGVGSIVEEGEVRPYAEAGVWTLDGNGNASGMISGSIDGAPFATREAFTATYEHVGDCVYAVVDQFDLQVDLYTTPAGTPMTYFSPGFSGVQFRQ